MYIYIYTYFKEGFYFSNYGKYIDHGLQQFAGIKKFSS